MKQEYWGRVKIIGKKLDDSTEALDRSDCEFLSMVVSLLGKEAEEVELELTKMRKGLPIISAARDLMIMLGQGKRDVTFELAEIHNGLRALDDRDYLVSKPGIIV